MKTALAYFGFVVFTMAALSSIGIGHFRMYYTAQPMVCEVKQ